jgi:dolichol-phosphate mannosyltransferase
VPVYNEQDTLPELRSRLGGLLARLDGAAEVILVDDGSTDHSWSLISGLHAADPRYKGLRLSRNFGHQVAITAGMDLAVGEATVVMDADLQDPPEVVLEMAERWREGYEVVYGVREDRSSDSWFKRSSASLFYSILSRFTDVEIPQEVGDFRLIDRRALEAFKSMREGDRFVRGMYAWIGFRQIGVPYQRAERHAGTTKYPLKKMMSLAADGMVGFSRVPLKIALRLGAFFAVVAVLGGIAVIGLNVVGATVPGWTSLLVAICFLGGLQLAVLGVIGAYLGRTYEETLGRPLYIVSQLRGIGFPIAPPARSVIAEPATVATFLGRPADLRDQAFTE